MPAVILAAALAAAAAACSSPSSTGTSSSATSKASTGASASASASASPAGTTALTGTAAKTLVAKALADTEAAPAVSMRIENLSDGPSSQPISADLTQDHKGGCEGSVGLSKNETLQLVDTGGYVWLKPSSGFYASIKLTQAEIGLIDGRWIKVASTDAQLGSFASLCDFSSLFGSMKATGNGWVATPTTYGGQNVYDVLQSGQPGYAYITNSATPLLVKVEGSGSESGEISFTEYSKPSAITPPSAADSIDGDGLGF